MNARRNYGWILGAFVLAVLLLFPYLLSSYAVHLLITILSLCYMAACWNITGGYGGQVLLCQGVFFAIGAYTSSLLLVRWEVMPWAGMLAGAVLAAIFGLLLGFLFFKYELKSHYFAVGTLALGAAIRVLFSNWDFVESTKGIILPIKDDSWYDFQFAGKESYYYIILGLLALIVLVTHYVHGSRLGIYLKAIRENEAAADSLGINRRKFKTLAMGITSFFTALAGTFTAQYMLYVHPEQFVNLNLSIESLCACLVGGSGTVWGPVWGGIIFGAAAEAARVYIGATYKGSHLIVNGIILMVMIIYLPRGIRPVLLRLADYVKTGGRKEIPLRRGHGGSGDQKP